MESTMKLIIAGIVGIIACITFAIIDKIHSKKYVQGSLLEAQSEDIIDVVTNYKRKQLQKTPWTISYQTYKIIAIISMIVLVVTIYIFTENIWLSILLSTIGLLIPELIVHFQSSHHKTDYEERFATGLRQMVAGLKSGLSIQQAVADTCSSPFVHDSIKDEFKAIDADLKLGIPIKEAFTAFAERVHFQDADDVAIAISMQEKIGGKEARVIESIAQNISDRLMLRKEVNSLFAGSKATVLTMDVVPFVIVALMYFLTPSYFAPFFENVALLVIFIVLLVFMGFGSIMIHRTIDKLRKECGL